MLLKPSTKSERHEEANHGAPDAWMCEDAVEEEVTHGLIPCACRHTLSRAATSMPPLSARRHIFRAVMTGDKGAARCWKDCAPRKVLTRIRIRSCYPRTPDAQPPQPLRQRFAQEPIQHVDLQRAITHPLRFATTHQTQPTRERSHCSGQLLGRVIQREVPQACDHFASEFGSDAEMTNSYR